MGVSGARMIPTSCNKHIIVSILYVLIEHEFVVRIKVIEKQCTGTDAIKNQNIINQTLYLLH